LNLPSQTSYKQCDIKEPEKKAMNARVIWRDRLTFTGTADTGFSLPLGADPSVGGDDDGFRPMELFAIGLAGCTAMDVISILRKKRQEITQFEVLVQADRASDYPRVFTDIQITYEITGHNVQESAVKRSIDLSENKYCPAHAMLRKAVSINCNYKIFEAS
jgi:putative redox protein